jgi:hypothetical protein
LIGSHLSWGTIAVPGDEPGFVVVVGKLDERGAQFFDGIEGSDPDVWSGRALQVDFAELAVSGLASMYPASDWSVLCSGPSWISARVRSH